MMKMVEYISNNKFNVDRYNHLIDEIHLIEDWEILMGLVSPFSSEIESANVAYNLLQEFGSLPAILSQSSTAMLRITGVTHEMAENLVLVSKASALIAEKRILQKPALNNWQAIENYCRTVIGYHGRQNVMAIFLDEEFRPILCEQISKGTVNSVAAYPREIITRLLELDAFSLIIAKNIPSGRLNPKECEINFANRLKGACELLDVYLMDAVLVGKAGVRSLLRN